MSWSFVIFIGSWILPLGFLKLLGSPCVDKIKHYKWRRNTKDARPSAAQHIGDALSEVVREGALLEGRQAVGDHMAHPRQMPKLATHDRTCASPSRECGSLTGWQWRWL